MPTIKNRRAEAASSQFCLLMDERRRLLTSASQHVSMMFADHSPAATIANVRQPTSDRWRLWRLLVLFHMISSVARGKNCCCFCLLVDAAYVVFVLYTAWSEIVWCLVNSDYLKDYWTGVHSLYDTLLYTQNSRFSQTNCLRVVCNYMWIFRLLMETWHSVWQRFYNVISELFFQNYNKVLTFCLWFIAPMGRTLTTFQANFSAKSSTLSSISSY